MFWLANDESHHDDPKGILYITWPEFSYLALQSNHKGFEFLVWQMLEASHPAAKS